MIGFFFFSFPPSSLFWSLYLSGKDTDSLDKVGLVFDSPCCMPYLSLFFWRVFFPPQFLVSRQNSPLPLLPSSGHLYQFGPPHQDEEPDPPRFPEESELFLLFFGPNLKLWLRIECSLTCFTRYPHTLLAGDLQFLLDDHSHRSVLLSSETVVLFRTRPKVLSITVIAAAIPFLIPKRSAPGALSTQTRNKVMARPLCLVLFSAGLSVMRPPPPIWPPRDHVIPVSRIGEFGFFTTKSSRYGFFPPLF